MECVNKTLAIRIKQWRHASKCMCSI